jgi:hypothetical protein
MTPTINQAELRTAMMAAPEPALSAMKAAYTEMALPSLAEPWESAEALLNAAQVLRDVAAISGYTLPIPLSTDVLKARIEALPVDLRDRAATESQSYNDGAGVPQMALPHRWTLDDWQYVDTLLSAWEEVAAARHRYVMASLGEASPSRRPETTEDEWRHMVVGCVTDGAESSSKRLTGPEADHLAKWAEAEDLHPTGKPPTAYVPDWKAISKSASCTQADLLAIAKTWLKARTLPTIAKLTEATTHPQARRLVAHVIVEAFRAKHEAEPIATQAEMKLDEVAPVVASSSPDPTRALDWTNGQVAAPAALPIADVTDVEFPMPKPDVELDAVELAAMTDAEVLRTTVYEPRGFATITELSNEPASAFVQIATDERGEAHVMPTSYTRLIELIAEHNAAVDVAKAANERLSEARRAVHAYLAALGFDAYGGMW